MFVFTLPFYIHAKFPGFLLHHPFPLSEKQHSFPFMAKSPRRNLNMYLPSILDTKSDPPEPIPQSFL